MSEKDSQSLAAMVFRLLFLVLIFSLSEVLAIISKKPDAMGIGSWILSKLSNGF